MVMVKEANWRSLAILFSTSFAFLSTVAGDSADIFDDSN
jgi:hypothetical protein